MALLPVLYLLGREQFCNDFVADSFPGGLRVVFQFRSEEVCGVAEKLRILHLLVHIEHVLLVGGGVAGYETEITVVGCHYAVKIQFAGCKSRINIEEVASFQSLIQGTDFCADEFVQFICQHIALAADPAFCPLGGISDKIQKSNGQSMNIYDNIPTRSTRWSKLYNERLMQ